MFSLSSEAIDIRIMKNTLKNTVLTGAIVTMLLTSTRAAEEGAIDFGKFKPAPGAEFVEVHIKSNLINMAIDLARKAEPEIADALKGLKSIRVNVLGLTDENRTEVTGQIEKVRTQLDGQGWDKIVTARQGDDDVNVWVKTRDSKTIEGVVVTVLEKGKNAIVVNVVGDIQPEKLAVVGERFDIEPLKKIPGKSKAQGAPESN